MVKIGIVVGSTRPGRKAEAVATWVFAHAKSREGASYQVVDIADFDLPLLDEAYLPMMHKYEKEHTKKWAEAVGAFDGYVFVSPEYNHGVPAALKNALDYLYAEWNDKAAGMVTYGSVGGARAAEQLRLVLSELKIASVRDQVMLSLFTDFENMTVFTPDKKHEKQLSVVLDEVEKWAEALKTVRK